MASQPQNDYLMLDPTCFRGGTRVKTGSGWKGIERVRRGEKVWTHAGWLRTVVGAQARPHTGRVVGLRLEGSEAVVWCTLDHRFLTLLPPSPQTERGNGGEASEEGDPTPFAPSPRVGRGSGGEVYARLGGLNPALITFARELRRDATKAEEILWQCLRAKRLNGLKFRRQHPLGAHYIADFYCPATGVAVELDGQVHNSRRARWADGIRHGQLQTAGVRVVRFRNEQVAQDLEGVLREIAETCAERLTLSLSPQAERGNGGEAQWRHAGNLHPGDFVIADEHGNRIRIVSITYEFTEETVFDLAVEEDHSFITESGVAHNCGSGTTAWLRNRLMASTLL